MWETGGEGGSVEHVVGVLAGLGAAARRPPRAKRAQKSAPTPLPPHSQPNPPPPPLSLQGLYMGVGLGLGGLVGGYVHKELGARHVFAVAACVVAAAWGLCAAAEVALGVGREEGGGREGEEGEGEG